MDLVKRMLWEQDSADATWSYPTEVGCQNWLVHRALIGLCLHILICTFKPYPLVLAQGGAANDGDVLDEDRSLNLTPAAVLLSVLSLLHSLKVLACFYVIPWSK